MEKPSTPAIGRPAAERVVSTKDLLGGAHRVWIEHAAERYLLTVTRSGKLILTK
jgi:hemin uptake protein HemP